MSPSDSSGRIQGSGKLILDERGLRVFILNRIAKISLLLLSFPLFAYSADKIDPKFALWNKISAPFEGVPRSLGSYNAGCVAGAQELPLDGDGYSVMKPSRGRYFGHPDLVRYLNELSKKARDEKLPLLLIGDMGRPRGGPMISGHASHQIGLDVDIWFRMSNKRPKGKAKEAWSAYSYVQGKKLKNWNKNLSKLVELAASHENVDRIFIHPVIKKYFCENYAQAPWLYKLRAWWGHNDHLHVRLKCPKGSESCASQEPLKPEDTQCGEDLAWFFSKEAEEELAKRQDKIAQRIFPELPAACEEMVEH